jgi:stearoyl-CoA desaturase (delta-9 desaturase)
MIKTILLFYLIYFIWLNLPILYIHRCLIHRQVEFSPILIYLAKIINWTIFSNYNQYREKVYAAAHILHHRYSDTEKDPQSPLFYSHWDIAFNLKLSMNETEVDKLTAQCEFNRTRLDDFLEQYSYGSLVLLIILFLIFSYKGIILWILLLSVRLVEACFAIIAHSGIGYTNYKNDKDRSHNILPIGIFYCGEELHNNHHSNPAKHNYAVKWYEFDTGYWILRLLELVKLVKFN